MQVTQSESIAKLTQALIKFHRSAPKIPKSSRNPFLKSNYADLSTILDLVQPVLNDCDLTVMQFPVGEHELTTTIAHESGEWMSSTYKMQPLESVVDKDQKLRAITPQSIGSVITYQRRYALGALLCLNIDDDNDGNPTSGQVTAEQAAPKKTAQQLMAEAAAAANAATQSVTETPKAPETTTKLIGATEGSQTASTSDKCSQAQEAQAKSLLGQWEQLQPGVTADFVGKMKQLGKKIADLSSVECDLLIRSLTEKNAHAFFSQLSPAKTS